MEGEVVECLMEIKKDMAELRERIAKIEERIAFIEGNWKTLTKVAKAIVMLIGAKIGIDLRGVL